MTSIAEAYVWMIKYWCALGVVRAVGYNMLVLYAAYTDGYTITV